MWRIGCTKLPVYVRKILNSRYGLYMDSDPIALDQRMQREVRKANTWYTENGMVVNPSKHHAMVLGFTDHQFSFTTKDSLDLVGMTIDSLLHFDKQVSLICKKSQQ